MANSSAPASPYAVPPTLADGLPPLASASNSSQTRAPPSDSPSPISPPPQAPPPPPSGPPSNDSSSPPPPAPQAPPPPPPGGPSSPPPPHSPSPSSPPPQAPPPPPSGPPANDSSSPPPPAPLAPAPPPPPTAPLSPPPPPHSPKSSPPPPFTGPQTPPPPDPPEVPTPTPRPPPESVNVPKSSPPPPPSTPTKRPSPPSRLTPPPPDSPSTPPPIAPSPPPSKQGAAPPASTLHPRSPTPSSLPSASSPTPTPAPREMSPTVKKSSSIGTGNTVGIVVGIGIFILSVIGLVIWGANRRRRKRRQALRFRKGHVIPTSTSASTASDYSVMKIPSSAPLIGGSSRSEFVYSPNEPPGGLGNSRLWFTYDDLAKATDRFSAENFLGKGGFGSVYKGRLQDGREVAVKQLKVGAKQGDREFKAEVDIISRIHHRYLVSLVGYCIAEDQKLLVYDYVPNNTLYFHLHGEKGAVLDWATRVKIAIGTARGLAYLHEDCHPRIIHRDIKSSNILLNNNFEARVSDFGLAKLALDAHTHITTRVMGTFGYMAPEYAISGKLTEKSDVYSFGVVLLELITGRKPVDTSQPLGDEGLVEWARPLMSHALEHEEYEGLADLRLRGKYVESEMFRMIEAAAACVRHSATKRPQMGQIVRAFNSFSDSDLSNGMRLGESELFDSAQQSSEIRAFQRMQFGSQGSSTEFFSQTTMTH